MKQLHEKAQQYFTRAASALRAGLRAVPPVVRGAVLAVLALCCYCLGYVCGTVVRVAAWCVVAFRSGFMQANGAK